MITLHHVGLADDYYFDPRWVAYKTLLGGNWLLDEGCFATIRDAWLFERAGEVALPVLEAYFGVERVPDACIRALLAERDGSVWAQCHSFVVQARKRCPRLVRALEVCEAAAQVSRLATLEAREEFVTCIVSAETGVEVVSSAQRNREGLAFYNHLLRSLR